MITVDKEKLADALGFPGQTVILTNDQECRAARAISDSHACQSVQEAVKAAKFWIEDAYREGVEAGKLAERTAWKGRISGMFGL